MPPRATAPGQMDLLDDWQPPAPVARFDDARVRASTIVGQMARAVAETLRHQAEAGTTREEIAARMSDFLGERVSKAMLDAYASQAREEHTISLPRFVALLHATADRRLLELLAERMGWVVIDRGFLPLIELAALREKEDELRGRSAALRRAAKRGGLL